MLSAGPAPADRSASKKKPGRDPEVPARLSGPESVSGAGSHPEGSARSVAASEKL
jgi:hypothetical protein